MMMEKRKKKEEKKKRGRRREEGKENFLGCLYFSIGVNTRGENQNKQVLQAKREGAARVSFKRATIPPNEWLAWYCVAYMAVAAHCQYYLSPPTIALLSHYLFLRQTQHMTS